MNDDTQLIAAIERQEELAQTVGDLSADRAKAIRYYRGDNTNPSEEGRSQFVSRDVYDVIETVKPSIMKMFMSGERVVQFDPVGPEDVQAARLETEYINHIALRKNDSWSVLGGLLHDGLLHKNGYALVSWEEVEECEEESYSGLSDDEFAFIAQAQDVEILEHTETVEDVTDAMGQPVGQMVTHDCKLRQTKKLGRVKYTNIAPEHALVDHNATSVQIREGNFFCRIEFQTIAELRDQGFDVPDDIGDGASSIADWLQSERQPWQNEQGDEPDPSMRRVKVREVWIRTALGSDDAELRHVILVGTTVLLNEEAEFIPVAVFCPKPLPHQHFGMSIFDESCDLQDLKTVAIRGALDNMYLANNGRYAINTDVVNLDDMLVSRPGGIVRVTGEPGSAIFPLTHPSTQPVALQMVEYIDQVKEQRTGMTRYTSGLDPNSLNQTATGIMQLQAASAQRMELIARNFGEAVKEIFYLTHSLTLKHGRKAEMIELNNEWVAIDPRTWKKRKDLTISVGLGTGNRQEQNAFLMQMLQLALGPGVQLGFSKPEGIYNMLGRLTNNAGFKAVNEFWTDPSKEPPKQPAPDPRLIVEQAKLQQAQQETQIDAQIKQAEMQAADREAAAKLQQQQHEAVLRAEVEMQKAQLQAETQLRIARMNAHTQRQAAQAQRQAAQAQRLMSLKVKRDGLQ